jgi:hypothetical protein
MIRALLLAVAVGAVIVGCSVTPPVPPAGPTPTVTTTDVPPIRDTFQTCDEARHAWDQGRIPESALIDGAVFIVHRDGTSEFCEIKRSTRARFGQP